MAIYDETMAPGYARWRTVHPQLLDALIAYGSLCAASCVLELGCGTGNYIRAVSERTGCAGWASIHRLLCWLEHELAFLASFIGSARRPTAPVWAMRSLI